MGQDTDTNPVLTPTAPSAWKGKVQVDGTDLLLPSENVARIKQISPQAFITSGLIPDPLSAIIKQAIHTKKGLPPNAMKKMTEDPEMLSSALELFDRVLTYVTVEPSIEMPPPCDVEVEGGLCNLYANQPVHQDPTRSGHHRYHEGQRDPNILYADQVEMDDKVFIFQWCLGGTRDLEKFRQEQQASVGSLSNG